VVAKAYVFVFGRPSMQAVNNVVLQLALRGHGYNNCCDPKRTGEERFLTILSKHNPRWCIDVGANRGQYARALLSLTEATVIAFEPLPMAFVSLSDLKAAFPKRLITVNQGLGDRLAEMDLHFGTEASECASFSEEANQIDWLSAVNRNIIKVQVNTLDNFFLSHPEIDCDEIDLLKIDTEGFEYEVLVGAKDTIRQKRPKFVQIEYNWHHLFKAQSLFKLASLLPGYVPYQLLPHGRGLTRRDIKRPESNIFYYSNFLFVRSDISV
jgi:FkbM family methyltransferase